MGKQAHAQLIRGLGGAHLLDSLTVVSAVRAWRGAGTLGLTGFFSSDVTASQYSVSHLKLPLSCYVKVLQLWHATWSVAVSPWNGPTPSASREATERAFLPALTVLCIPQPARFMAEDLLAQPTLPMADFCVSQQNPLVKHAQSELLLFWRATPYPSTR